MCASSQAARSASADQMSSLAIREYTTTQIQEEAKISKLLNNTPLPSMQPKRPQEMAYLGICRHQRRFQGLRQTPHSPHPMSRRHTRMHRIYMDQATDCRTTIEVVIVQMVSSVLSTASTCLRLLHRSSSGNIAPILTCLNSIGLAFTISI